ncbi:MAG: UDP-N-acetylmuramate dehydrogenase [Thermoleophilia bacterium]
MPDERLLREIETAAGRPGIRNTPLERYTYFGAGGAASLLLPVETAAGLAAALAVIKAQDDLPWFVIGGGTNLLVADDGYRGVVIMLAGELKAISFEDDNLVCGGGATLSRAARQAADQGLGGLEPLALIPGTVGGALAMNAGAFGVAIGDLVRRVDVCSPAGSLTVERSQLQFGYRTSSLSGGVVVTSTVLELHREDPERIREAMAGFSARRRAAQPRGQRTFGSVFKNPETGPGAGALLEQAGCKGLSAGGAEVSEVHANFIVNKGNGTAADVVQLMNQCRQRVAGKFGVVLEPEVEFLGDISLEAL